MFRPTVWPWSTSFSRGGGGLHIQEGGAEARLESGQTWLVPADADAHRIDSGGDTLRLLAVEAVAETGEHNGEAS